MNAERNRFERDGLVLEQLDSVTQICGFTCGEEDLDDYFANDNIHHRRTLFTQTYKLYAANDPEKNILALVDFCNDSLDNEVVDTIDWKKIEFPKRNYKSYPAVKIARLGVQKEAQGRGLGACLLNMIKEFFTTNNRSGCRLITVDAYRAAVPFYLNNGFRETVFRRKNKLKGLSPETIKAAERLRQESPTVSLFFDLMSVASARDVLQ